MAAVTKEPGWSAVFLGVAVLSLLVNLTFITVILKRRRLRNGHFGLWLSLAVLDVSAGFMWAVLSGVATGLGWGIPGEACRLQSYLLTLTQTITALTLATIALERLLIVTKPSRHAMVFVSKVVVFLVAALWLFCSIVSSIHLYGSTPVSWQAPQRQCAAAFTENTRLLDLTFCIDHAIPYWVLALPAIVLAFVKVFLARRHAPQTGEITLERNLDAPGDSYSARLSSVQSRFSSSDSKLFTNKQKKAAKKPTLGKRKYTPQGYTEPEHYDSDIEDGGADTGTVVMRIYLLAHTDYAMLRASAATIFVTWLLWLPWIIARFNWNYTPRETMSDGLEEMAIVCMNVASIAKPVVYTVFNPHFRDALVKTVMGCRSLSK